MRGIIKIVSKEHQLKNGTLEFDINKLSPKTNRALEKYVNQCLEEADRESGQNAPGSLF